MNPDLIKKEYDEIVPYHEQLAINLKEAISGFLHDNNISYHTVTFRVKEKKSYLDKIERKGYSDHKNQIEDLCGLRIVCYYPEDLEQIGKIINNEFNVIESINKTNTLESDRFGYRSDHYIVTIKNEWAKAPNYRNLKNFKAEIQVRTILMHAWADIEHKLAYKSKEQIPNQFRRKLYQLSALLEIADEQFQDLKINKDKLKKSMIIKSSNKKSLDTTQELNLDTLQSLLDFYFPKLIKSIKNTSNLFEALKPFDFKLKDLDQYILKYNSLNIDLSKEINLKDVGQVSTLYFIMDVMDDQFWESRKTKKINHKEWVPAVLKTRKSILKF